MNIATLIEDYQRRLQTLSGLLQKKGQSDDTVKRLVTKQECYRYFLVELDKVLRASGDLHEPAAVTEVLKVPTICLVEITSYKSSGKLYVSEIAEITFNSTAPMLEPDYKEKILAKNGMGTQAAYTSFKWVGGEPVIFLQGLIVRESNQIDPHLQMFQDYISTGHNL